MLEQRNCTRQMHTVVCKDPRGLAMCMGGAPSLSQMVPAECSVEAAADTLKTGMLVEGAHGVGIRGSNLHRRWGRGFLGRDPKEKERTEKIRGFP